MTETMTPLEEYMMTLTTSSYPVQTKGQTGWTKEVGAIVEYESAYGSVNYGVITEELEGDYFMVHFTKLGIHSKFPLRSFKVVGYINMSVTCRKLKDAIL